MPVKKKQSDTAPINDLACDLIENTLILIEQYEFVKNRYNEISLELESEDIAAGELKKLTSEIQRIARSFVKLSSDIKKQTEAKTNE